MHYHVTILYPGRPDIWNVFSSYEFEDGDLDRWVNRWVHELWPNGKYTRDNAGVIVSVDGVLVVEIDAI